MIIADSSPLIFLAVIDKLELIKILFDDVLIPEAVYKEITQYNKLNYKVLDNYFLRKVKKINNLAAAEFLKSDIDDGESEVIVLASELGVDHVLMDDSKGRRRAELYGLKVKGTLSVLIQAKRNGVIESVKEQMDSLISHGFRIDHALYSRVLAITEE